MWPWDLCALRSALESGATGGGLGHHLMWGSRPETLRTQDGASGSAEMRSASEGRGVLHW